MKSPLSLTALSLLVAVASAAGCGPQLDCIMTYIPVCGSDGQTYSNQCALHRAACFADKPLTKLFDGPCDSAASNPFCAMKCSTVASMPVCGSNGKTYNNPCLLHAARCGNVTITAAHEGACNATTKPPTSSQKPTAKPSTKPTPKPMPTPKVTPKTTPKACNSVCPMIYSPVCGSDGKTYSNPCQLSAAACKDKSLKLTTAHSGECETPPPTCAKGCPKILLPVCGSNGKTYNNQCLLENASCSDKTLRKAYDGECAKAHPATCIKGCTKILLPVCGTNGKTYSNQCLLENAACSDKTLRKAYDGECAKAPSAACAVVRCAQFTECRVDATTGRAFCADVCDPRRCAVDEVCSLRQVQCSTTPCPPVATCSKKP